MKMRLPVLPARFVAGGANVQPERHTRTVSRCPSGLRAAMLMLGVLAGIAFAFAAPSSSGVDATPGRDRSASFHAAPVCLADAADHDIAMVTTIAQHWPFWGGGLFVGSAAIGLGAWLFRHRGKAVELPKVLAAVEEERKRIAQDLHDDLGSRLSEIGLLSTPVSLVPLSETQARRRLERIEQQADSSVRSLDQIVWAINPANDCISSVVSYFCLYAQQFLRETSVGCRLEVATDLPEQLLGPDPRHQLFLAYKEALHNVVRHAAASEVRIGIAVRRGALLLRVEDNGRGLPAQLPPAGADGLRNMRQRLERLGGRCAYRSSPGRGLTVTFELPLRPRTGNWLDRLRCLARRLTGAPTGDRGTSPSAGFQAGPRNDDAQATDTAPDRYLA